MPATTIPPSDPYGVWMFSPSQLAHHAVFYKHPKKTKLVPILVWGAVDALEASKAAKPLAQQLIGAGFCEYGISRIPEDEEYTRRVEERKHWQKVWEKIDRKA